MDVYEYRITYADPRRPEGRTAHPTVIRSDSGIWQRYDHNALREEGEPPVEPNLTGIEGLVEATRRDVVAGGGVDARVERRLVGPWEDVTPGGPGTLTA